MTSAAENNGLVPAVYLGGNAAAGVPLEATAVMPDMYTSQGPHDE
jgi:hypothetical protein